MTYSVSMKHQDPLVRIKTELAAKYDCSYVDVDKFIRDFFMEFRKMMGDGKFNALCVPHYGTWYAKAARVKHLNRVAAMSPELKKDKYARITKEKHDRLLSQIK
jgi:hypothetical protein